MSSSLTTRANRSPPRPGTNAGGVDYSNMMDDSSSSSSTATSSSSSSSSSSGRSSPSSPPSRGRMSSGGGGILPSMAMMPFTNSSSSPSRSTTTHRSPSNSPSRRLLPSGNGGGGSSSPSSSSEQQQQHSSSSSSSIIQFFRSERRMSLSALVVVSVLVCFGLSIDSKIFLLKQKPYLASNRDEMMVGISSSSSSSSSSSASVVGVNRAVKASTEGSITSGCNEESSSQTDIDNDVSTRTITTFPDTIPIKPHPSKPIRQISIVGERNSGTTWMTQHLQKCFNTTGVTVADYFIRYKHFFQQEHVREYNQHNDTLVLAMFRNPYHWVEAMRDVPHHAPMHYKLNWKEYLDTPWTMPRSDADLALLDGGKIQPENVQCQFGYRYTQMNSCLRDPFLEKGSYEDYFDRYWKDHPKKRLKANLMLHNDDDDDESTEEESDEESEEEREEETEEDEDEDDEEEEESTTTQNERHHHERRRRRRRRLARKKYPGYSGRRPQYELRLDGSGKAYESILDLRADKIRNFLDIGSWTWVSSYKAVRYEDMLRHGTEELIQDIETLTGVKALCQPSPPQNRPQRELKQDMIEYMNEKVDWDTEALVGYRPLTYLI